jgi:geranylgeranyl diphosphate synthase type I
MTLNKLMDEMLPAIEAELKMVVSSPVNVAFPELREMLTYHMGWEGEGAGADAQGKRIRPLLVLLCAQAAGQEWRRALPAAAAVELLHNFSLIHDDIQDHSELRRGRPTVWTKWGVAQTINAGDVMYTLAFWALQRLEETTTGRTVLEASRCLQLVCLRLTEGQYLDLSYETRAELSLADYWPMIQGKTSALLGGCAELGALVGGANSAQQAYFREFGIKLGLAFQVLDDWLGIWGEAALTGKSTESDLVSGKKTLPVLYALEQHRAFAKRCQVGPILAQDVAEAALLLKQDGAEDYTLEQAGRLTAESQEALRNAVPVEENAAHLRELAGMLLKRKN